MAQPRTARGEADGEEMAGRRAPEDKHAVAQNFANGHLEAAGAAEGR